MEQKRQHPGDVLLLDHLPATVTVGCDAVAFSTTEQFRGCRDLPPGTHLIWVAPSAANSSRSGQWIVIPPRSPEQRPFIHVKQWDSRDEVLCNPRLTATQQSLAERLPAIASRLPPYNLQFSEAAKSVELPSFMDRETVWDQLTFAISTSVLETITGRVSTEWSVTTSDRITGEIQLPAEAQLYAESGNQLAFTFPIHAKLFNPKSTGEERTRQALDPSNWILKALGASQDGRTLSNLIGEMQFAFLTGMHLGNFSCLEQWWFMVNRILLRSYDLTVSSPVLCQSLIRTFHIQLIYNDQFLEGDIFEAMPDETKSLQRTLTIYKARLFEKLQGLGAENHTPDHDAVQEAFSLLESWIQDHLGWDLSSDYVRSGKLMLEDGEEVEAELSDFEDEDERGEFAATIVEMDAHGRPTDMISWTDK